MNAPKRAARGRPAAFLLSAAGLACLPPAASAQSAPAAEPAPPFTVGGNVTVVSDYLVRGISQTQRGPALQGQVDLTHASGLYGSVFGSNVSRAAYPNGQGYEIDLIGGWRTALPAGFGLDLNYNVYLFPGAHVDAPLSGGGDRRIRSHTQEFKTAVTHGAFSAGAALVTSRYLFAIFGTDAAGDPRPSRGSLYLEANWNPTIADGVTANLHAGRQRIRNFEALNFSDYRLGVVVEGRRFGLPGWVGSLAWVNNTGNRTLWTFTGPDGGSRVVVGPRWVATLGHVF